MKILVFRNGRLGDVVMILPALRALLEEHPDAQVHVLTSRDGERVLRNFDTRIACVYLYSGLRPWRQLQTRRLLAYQHYDRIYCLETRASYARLFRVRGSDLRLMVNPAGHAADCSLQVLAPSVTPLRPRGARYLRATEAGMQRAAALLAQAGIGPDTVLVGFHPTCSGTRAGFWRGRKARVNKEWPAMHFAALAERLLAHAEARGQDMRILIDLLPDERKYGERVVAASGGRILLQTAPPDFERYKATLQRMDLLITPDSGPMHLAAALGTPLVALFSGSDPAGCGPYAPKSQFRVLRAEHTAEPTRGVGAITPEQVFAAACELLEGWSAANADRLARLGAPQPIALSAL